MRKNLDSRFRFAAGVLSATLVAWWSGVGLVRAVDGVVEINQASALQGGVTPGDAPDFPVTIDRSGSYRLTGNLSLPDENTTGIEVLVDDVTIDLNGFAVTGPVTCSGFPVTSCSPSGGTGDGIVGFVNTRVTNGTVRGVGRWAITTGSWASVEGLRVFFNGHIGIGAGYYSHVLNNIVTRNGYSGIDMRAQGSIVAGNTVVGNKESGIVLSGNDGGVLLNNNSIRNGGFGLELVIDGYVGNVFNGNLAGTVSGPGVELGSNLCNGTTTCP